MPINMDDINKLLRDDLDQKAKKFNDAVTSIRERVTDLKTIMNGISIPTHKEAQRIYDTITWRRKLPWSERLILRMFRKSINRYIHHVVTVGYNNGDITSQQMHGLVGTSNAILFPEWNTPQ